jgi:hypothetical protein
MATASESESLTVASLLLKNAEIADKSIDYLRTRMDNQKNIIDEATEAHECLKEQIIEIITNKTRQAIAFINEKGGPVEAEKVLSEDPTASELSELFSGEWLIIDIENQTVTIEPVFDSTFDIYSNEQLSSLLTELKEFPAFAKKIELKNIDSSTANTILGMDLASDMEELILRKTSEHITSNHNLGITTLTVDTMSWPKPEAWQAQQDLKVLNFDATGADAPIKFFARAINKSGITKLNITCDYEWFSNSKGDLRILKSAAEVNINISAKSLPKSFQDLDDNQQIEKVLQGFNRDLDITIN